jgi:hypothetical protein
MDNDKEYKTDLLSALQVLDTVITTAWHHTGFQEYRCNTCGGIGAYPRAIDHRHDCALKRGSDLIEKYRETLISTSHELLSESE